ncbi:MAG TPA: hypothetical protein VHC86_05835 [Opitutaceae bacterium]|nr:hypothetical protein [Opitutaceae bacterium]
MTDSAPRFTWMGMGWLNGQPAERAWLILGSAAALGLLIIVLSYSFTLVPIAPWRRAVLCALRFALWIALLLILAAPTRVERVFDKPPAPRPLAVLVDRSDSMTTPDNRHHRRIDEALLKWHRIDGAARDHFGAVSAFAFAEGLAPVKNPDDPGRLPGGRTDLFSGLQSALNRAPVGGWGALIILTDGLDTSGAEVTEAARTAVRDALAAGTPLYFISGHNRSVEPPFFRIREFNLPPQAAPHSVVQLDAVFDSYQAAGRQIPVELAVNGVPRPLQPLAVEAGRHMEAWSAEEPVEAPGAIRFELRAGAEIARAEVRVAAPASNRILYDEGALDWGYRFLADMLRRGNAFTVTPVFDFPNAGLALPPGAIAQMPVSAQGLAPYSIIVLANVVANQLPTAEQQALTQWVNDGGVLIFLTPDDDSTQGFAGSELEKILPVVFSGPEAAPPAALAQDQARFRPGRPGSYIPARPPAMMPFAWDSPAVVQQILSSAANAPVEDQTPRFSSYAHIERAKPGAQVLARHPTESGPDGRGAILLAVQRYGRGKSVVFTTDALWRWKLGEASSARGVELFWENFFSWLSRDRAEGFYFNHPPVRSTINAPVTLRIAGAGMAPLQVAASLGTRSVSVTEQAAEGASRVFRWSPPAPGLWEIEARGAPGERAHAWLLAVKEGNRSRENSGAAPDEELLSALATQTGGAVLDDAPADWKRKPPPPQLLAERRQPLWDRRGLFAAIVGLYGIEMILRRRWRLL